MTSWLIRAATVGAQPAMPVALGWTGAAAEDAAERDRFEAASRT